MDSKFWLLLLIISILLIGGSMLLLSYYANLKKKVGTRLKDSREQLFLNRKKLGDAYEEYHKKFSHQDAGKYGLLAQKYQRKFEKSQESNLNGLQQHRLIVLSLPKPEKMSLRYTLGGFDRLQKYWRADRGINQLQADIKVQADQVVEVERSLQELKDLPLVAATKARKSRELCRETRDLLEHLANEDGLGGKTMEESIHSIQELEKDLEAVPVIFYDLTPVNKTEIDNALQILEPALERLNKLMEQAIDWKRKVEELHRTAGILEERVGETVAHFNRLNTFLILSVEQEQISSMTEKAGQIKADLAALTVEKLDATWDKAKETLEWPEVLADTLDNYDERLQKLQSLISKTGEWLQAVETAMQSASTRQEYSVLWNESQIAFEAVKGKLASIPSLSERRTPGELDAHLAIANAGDLSLAKLQAATNQVVADLDQVSMLWIQLQPAYTDEWLAGVEQLFSEMSKYDVKSNWDPADNASSLYTDARILLQQTSQNIPASRSLKIDEQQVGPRLLAAKDLAEKKPLFDARKARIETRLRQIQEEEKEALSLYKRIAPVVILFASEIRSIRVPTKHAKTMLVADATRVTLEKSLEQRDKGNISKKLDAVRKWERTAAENGAMVYRWFEDDLLKRKVSVSASLREIESFAEDLEDDVVVRAHKYDLVFAPSYIDAELIRKQPLDAIHGESIQLFTEWQEVMDCQGELRKFIAPVREEYDRMQANLNRLRENCKELETRLNRNWPVVFQTARYLRAKVDNLEKDIGDIRKLKWKRSDLQKNYYFLSQRLRDLGSEADNLRLVDEQEAAEMDALEQEYKNIVREYARRIYEGNENGIRKETASAEAFLYSLAEQYKNGRKTGSNTPSALETKANLQRKTETYKQQIAEYKFVRMNDNLLDRERKSQFLPTGKDIAVPLTRTDFITTLFRLITDLQKLSNQHPDIEDACEDLRSALTEARKNNRPDSAQIRLLLKGARGTLVDVENIVPEVAPVMEAISMLTGVVKSIFG